MAPHLARVGSAGAAPGCRPWRRSPWSADGCVAASGRSRSTTRPRAAWRWLPSAAADGRRSPQARPADPHRPRSEEHTSELQSHHDLVCRLLLEKKKKTQKVIIHQKKKKIKN